MKSKKGSLERDYDHLCQLGLTILVISRDGQVMKERRVGQRGRRKRPRLFTRLEVVRALVPPY